MEEQMLTSKNQHAYFYIPLMYLGVFFAAALIGADLLTYKLINVFGFTASAALIFFPLTYAIGDITTEVYGKSIAMRLVLISIGAEFYVDTVLSLVSHLPSSAEINLSSAFTKVLGPLQGIFWGNIIALTASALMNVAVMSRLKSIYKGHYFIIRSLIATFSSEIVYIIIAYTIWFVGRVSIQTLLTMMAISMLFKIIFALVVAYPSIVITRRIASEDPRGMMRK
jgi:uncharacterized integral membrane protein (TIGR00697 family)